MQITIEKCFYCPICDYTSGYSRRMHLYLVHHKELWVTDLFDTLQAIKKAISWKRLVSFFQRTIKEKPIMTTYTTQMQIFDALKAGKRIKHNTWSAGRFVELKPPSSAGILVDETGEEVRKGFLDPEEWGTYDALAEIPENDIPARFRALIEAKQIIRVHYLKSGPYGGAQTHPYPQDSTAQAKIAVALAVGLKVELV